MWTIRSSCKYRLWGIAAISLVGCNDDVTADSEHSHDHGEHAHDDVSASAGATAEPPVNTVTDGFEWQLPKKFRRPIVPADNPMSTAKVELGRHLFYDKRLSDNQTFSCASCHEQKLAFADAKAVGFGSTGESHTRGAMSLANVGYTLTLTWANPTVTQLEHQAETPLFGTAPIELGMKSSKEVEERLRTVPRYRELFAEAYRDEAEPITMQNVDRALASFERTLISGNSPYDRYFYGDEKDALSESAVRGMFLVTATDETQPHFECNHCHGTFNFSDHTTWEGQDRAGMAPPFHQTGLYDLDGRGSYPEPNTGIFSVTKKPEDMGKFKAPTLRNIALTAPYMHDGSIPDLAGVLDHYAKGGRHRVPGKTDALLKPFTITEQQKKDVIAFLESLTDADFISEPRFSDPWPAETGGDTSLP
jgi:cytochrome c peroxidase